MKRTVSTFLAILMCFSVFSAVFAKTPFYEIVDYKENEIYKVRFIDIAYDGDKVSKYTVYDAEGVSVCKKIVDELEKMDFESLDGGMVYSGTVDYTELILTDWRGYTHKLTFAGGFVSYRKSFYKYNFGQLTKFKSFMDGFEEKTVVDTASEDITSTESGMLFYDTLSKPENIDHITVDSVCKGIPHTKADFMKNFSFIARSDNALSDIAKLLSKVEITKNPTRKYDADYDSITFFIKMKNGNGLTVELCNDGSVYIGKGSFYGSVTTDFIDKLYEICSIEYSDTVFVEYFTEYYKIDLFTKDISRVIFSESENESTEDIVITDVDYIKALSTFIIKHMSAKRRLNMFDEKNDKTVTLTLDYSDGTQNILVFESEEIVSEVDGMRYTLSGDYYDAFLRFFEYLRNESNISASFWAKDSIRSAVMYGFSGIDNLNGDFTKKLTREEVCNILGWIYTDALCLGDKRFESPFNDTWNTNVFNLYSIGAIEGKKEIMVEDVVWKREFAPNDLVTREELAKIILILYDYGLNYDYYSYDLYEVSVPEITKTDFADDSEISDWAKPYVQLCRDNGIFMGDDKGNFNPKGNCTMEEVIAVALRAYEEIIKAQTAK